MGKGPHPEIFKLWIDRMEKVISFQPVDNTEEHQFVTWNDLFCFAMTYAKEEYRFQ